MNIFITGGCGFVGTVLVPRLLKAGHKVTVYDICYFGNFLKPHPSLEIYHCDIRDIPTLKSAMSGHDAVVHMACISNDASFELDDALSTSINMDAFGPLVDVAKANRVKRFIYASTSSVYGVSDKKDVTEDHPLVPLTLYNKYKGLCEPILLERCDDKFTGVIFRPATVCGYSPRMRLDLSVNILTNHAVNNGVVTVFGGAQMRPNLHILDYCEAVELFLTAPAAKIQGETFNVGYQNKTIIDIANVVKSVVQLAFPRVDGYKIVTQPSGDVRSYHINSDKIARVLGFKPRRSIEIAVADMCDAFRDGLLPDSMDDDRYYNVKRLKRLRAA